jgi:hypothetical protein
LEGASTVAAAAARRAAFLYVIPNHVNGKSRDGEVQDAAGHYLGCQQQLFYLGHVGPGGRPLAAHRDCYSVVVTVSIAQLACFNKFCMQGSRLIVIPVGPSLHMHMPIISYDDDSAIGNRIHCSMGLLHEILQAWCRAVGVM